MVLEEVVRNKKTPRKRSFAFGTINTLTAVPPGIVSKDTSHQGSNKPLPSITGASVIPY